MVTTPMRRLVLPAFALAALPLLGVGTPTAQAEPYLPYGPDTCIDGYVWRNANDADHVCVTPDERDSEQGANRFPHRHDGGCEPRMFFREAFPGDTVCVNEQGRQRVWDDNGAAATRLAINHPELGPKPPEQPPQQPERKLIQDPMWYIGNCEIRRGLGFMSSPDCGPDANTRWVDP